jgi:hypothetical protein
MTHAEMIVAAKSAATTGAATLAIQVASASPMDAMSVFLPLISAAVGGGVAYGILKATISAMGREIGDIKRDLHTIRQTVTSTGERVATIEGILDAEDR